MEYYSLNAYLRHTFGTKVYKISLDAGCSCPNRDGLIDTRGCIFCSASGSGDFAEHLQMQEILHKCRDKQARDRAQKEHEMTLEKTRVEADAMLEKAKSDIANEQEKATKAAEAEIAKLALIAARKIVKTGDAHDAGSNQ